MSTEGGQKAILAALAANLGIAIAKFVGFAFTGAASMLIFLEPDVEQGSPPASQ